MRRGRPVELPGAWGKAAAAAGSVAALAEVLGVTVRTIERWAVGGCPLRRMDAVETAFAARKWPLPEWTESKGG